MTDVHTPAVRSYNMRQVKSSDTKPELVVRNFLQKKGFKFRTNDEKLPGKPDIVLKSRKTVIFIHGCFWHGHAGCKYFIIPKTRTSWWIKKITTNKINDRSKRLVLRKLGWKQIVIWECKLRANKKERTLTKLLSVLN